MPIATTSYMDEHAQNATSTQTRTPSDEQGHQVRTLPILAERTDQEAVELRQSIDLTQDFFPPQALPKSQNLLLRLWRRHVAMAVPHDKCRDHLG